MTRTLAFQMSGPVPSPSMNGMIGWSGTWSLPFWTEILAPPAGGLTLGLVGVDIVAILSRAGRGRDANTRVFSTIRPDHAQNPGFHARRRRLPHARRMGATRRLLDA